MMAKRQRTTEHLQTIPKWLVQLSRCN